LPITRFLPTTPCLPHLLRFAHRFAYCRPDLLLVERSVARSAQEELLQRGIALVQHTKPELLERLGRCMGVKVRLLALRNFAADGVLLNSNFCFVGCCVR
jgi:hypothetical protein